MTLTLDNNNAQYQIRAYQPGIIQVNEQTFTHSIIITPQKLVTDWPPQNIAELRKEHFILIKKLRPAILLLGTGDQPVAPTFLPPDIYGDLINLGLGVEIMNTSAACRTYNALTAEDRNVIAALLIK